MDDPSSSSKSKNPGWFRKGRSGNPKGRPRGSGKQARASSAFEVLLDKTLTVTVGNRTREISLEQALHERTFKDAFAGKRMAIKEVLQWIAANEDWQAKHAGKPASAKWEGHLSSPDPDNADEALLLLGIAGRNPNREGPDYEGAKWPRA